MREQGFKRTWLVHRVAVVMTLALTLTLTLISPVITATSAPALAFKTAPANYWGKIVAAEKPPQIFNSESVDTTSTTTSTSSESAQDNQGEKLSNFEVTYINVPERAKAAIEKGVEAWERVFESKVDIKVEAYWDRTAPYGVLGTARPGKYFNSFEGAPDKELWYASALANALAGRDLDPLNPEIIIRLSSIATWYLGVDGKPGASQYDLASVVLHEIGHGVGFLSNSEVIQFTNFGSLTQPTPFDAYAQLPDGRRLMDLPSPSLELGVALTNTLYWSGNITLAINNGVKPLLYTPKTYELGSSISHLDEITYPKGSINAAMTPNLEAGEVLNAPGPLAEAMIADMKVKPPAGIAFGTPSEPRNVKALVGSSRAIVIFDPPSNARTAQVSSYIITTVQTGQSIEVASSPAVIRELKNGEQYSFDITALNENGQSPRARSNLISPEKGWKRTVLDANADGKFLASAIFQGKRVIAYTDSQNGDVKLATFDGSRWVRRVIDGNSNSSGRTSNNVSGYLSLCTSGSGLKERLHLFYTDLTDKDLRYGEFDGKRWKFEIVDGNGPAIQNYEEKIRVTTGSDVSVSNACVATPAGLQVFYRDESQGILLGAVRSRGKWLYEIVDGNKKVEGRSIGDVGFRLRATSIGSKVYLVYDSILVVDQNRDATQGEVRFASRSSIYPEDWSYQNLEISSETIAVPGYDLSIFKSKREKKVYTSWLASTPLTRPKPDRVKSRVISEFDAPIAGFADDHGFFSAPLAEDSIGISFGCQERLCAMGKKNQSVRLIIDEPLPPKAMTLWITLNKKRYVVAGINGKVTLLSKS